jgi:hypothetical protein
MATHRIVVSLENTPFFGWQAKLFYYSCVTRLGLQPLFIVHATGGPWEPEFYELARAGATIKMAPSYVIDKRLPRNSAGTLLHAAEMCTNDDFMVLCDPDLLFVRKVRFPAFLAGNFYSYLHYRQPFIETAAKKLGLQPALRRRRDPQLCCGVPYVIPVRDARLLAETWLEAVDAFPQRGFDEMWMDIMYAFGLALLKLGWKLRLTHQVATNILPYSRLRHDIVHYSNGDDAWDKRHFLQRQDISRVWRPPFEARKGTVADEVFRQINQAKKFYEDSGLGGKISIKSSAPGPGRKASSAE